VRVAGARHDLVGPRQRVRVLEHRRGRAPWQRARAMAWVTTDFCIFVSLLLASERLKVQVLDASWCVLSAGFCQCGRDFVPIPLTSV
jgi:hypothetical protein